MKRYILIVIICLLTMIYCNNKRYEKLVEENKRLLKLKYSLENPTDSFIKEQIKSYKKYSETIKDSLNKGLFGQNKDSILAAWNYIRPMNFKKFGKTNQAFNCKGMIKLVDEKTSSKPRIINSVFSNMNDSISLSKDKSEYSFTPTTNDTRIIKVEYTTINNRNGRVNNYTAYDTIFILN